VEDCNIGTPEDPKIIKLSRTLNPVLMESKDYNLSLDVANFLSMTLSSDTHTFSLA
jgi:hypothetical protein